MIRKTKGQSGFSGKLLSFATILAVSLCALPAGAQFDSTVVCVEQEANVGAGDFNFVGVIDVFDGSGGSAADWYSYGVSFPASYGATSPMALADTSQLFVVETNDGDGPTLFFVHDQPEDGDGGINMMQFNLTSGTAGVLVEDEPNVAEEIIVTGGGKRLMSPTAWPFRAALPDSCWLHGVWTSKARLLCPASPSLPRLTAFSGTDSNPFSLTANRRASTSIPRVSNRL
jgi:hypothetical protein